MACHEILSFPFIIEVFTIAKYSHVTILKSFFHNGCIPAICDFILVDLRSHSYVSDNIHLTK